ncbi:MAG TPA: glycosyltransferase family 9 protein [Vicinamibacterales bacterium]|nr:glycosyltransferase family 9 protein [Vicinamibacterales bacterium]
MNVLLLRLRLIGDVVFTTPIVRALARAYPGVRLTYVVEPAAAPVVACSPHLEEVIVAPRRRGVRRIADDLALARRLRRRRFDLAIDLHGGPRSAWLAWASGAPERIGYAIRGRRWMYTRVVARPADLAPRHCVVNQWDLLAALPGWRESAPDPGADPVEMPLDLDADARIAARLTRAGVGPADALVVVHVSAGNPFRRWPEEAFVEFVSGLAGGSPARRIVLSSGPSDRGAADRIARAARARLGAAGDRVLDLGEFDLAELRALIGRSRLFVGGDTGPLHIAATTTTPVVGLYGPTLPARSAPWRDPRYTTLSVDVQGLPCRPCRQRTCVPGDFRCLTSLRPERVIAAAEQALSA